MLVSPIGQIENRSTVNGERSFSLSVARPAAHQQDGPIDRCQSSSSLLLDTSFHELFEAQVEKSPEAIALVFANEAITYRTLNARANQLARYLQRLGVGPETLVGICVERSIEMVVALLGVLKAGGAYVPLDPTYPIERLTYLLADSQAQTLLTQSHLLPRLAEAAVNTATQIVCLDRDNDLIAREGEENKPSNITAENLAYVIYTSGSTGQPKGAMIEHGGLVNYLTWCLSAYPVSEGTGSVVHSSLAFDLTVTSLFAPLLVSKKVILIPDELGVEGLCAVLRQEHNLSLVKITPAHLKLLGNQLRPEEAAGRTRAFVIGGENLTAEHIAFWRKYAPETRLFNEYGPTETVVGCCVYEVPADQFQTGTIPIGHAINHTQLYILDEQLQSVPIGAVGELYIGGKGVGRGYLHKPTLTAEKFIEYPIATSEQDQSGARPQRLYRTGDLVRLLPEGLIECLGRVDFQVKIRGYRIELGEIETALCTHPSVRECVVTAHEAGPDDKRLVAYYIAERDTLPTSNTLRQHLKQTLPDYMVPSAFMRLDSFPLSPNGKLERRQLPAPQEVSSAREEEYEAPANEIESKLVNIWEQTLRLPLIGVTDNFFDLGGHSLLALRIFWDIEEQFGKKLPLATLFQFPTIRQLAQLLAAQNWQPSWSSLVPLQVEGDSPPFFCVHAVGGNVLEYYELARQMGPSQPFFGLQSVGLDGHQTPLTSIEAMAAHYIYEMRQFQPQGPYYLGGRSFGGMVAYEMAQQLHEQGQEVALVALLDADPIGWLKLFPRRTALQLRLRFLARRIQRHFTNLSDVSFASKLAYLREKIGYQKRTLETWRWRISRIFKPEQNHSYTLRDVEELNYLASEKYIPRPYSGSVTFFCAEEEVSADENQFGWETLATGKVKVIAVPGNHQSMIKEPFVQLLAEQLKLHFMQPAIRMNNLSQETGTMRQITQRIEHLSPAKRALLEIQLRQRKRVTEKKIQLRENPAVAPLTFNQESLWFLEQLNPNTSTYNLYDAMRLRGALNVQVLQQTLETIVARHETLRTTFADLAGEAQQVIHEAQTVTIHQVDLSQHAEGEKAMLSLLSQEAERPFDLTCGPLVRFTLITLPNNEHVLFVLMHHILSDGWSLGVFWQEFAQLYTSFQQRQAPALAPLPIQFGDYAQWERQQKAKEINEQLAYWKTQLNGAPALLELPTDRPRPAVQSFRGAQECVMLSDPLRQELKTFSKQERVTLFMTLLAAFNALLLRYTGQEDIVLGSPLAGRAQEETENLIGFFANVLVLRTDLSGNPSFRELLKRTQNTVLGAFSHQEVPFEKLVAELRPERSLSYNPIFQTAFALQNEAVSELAIPGLALNPVKVGVVNSKFDLFFSLCEVPEGLRATVEYNTDLFDATTIQRLLTHYQNILIGLLSDPTMRVSDLPMLSQEEIHQALVEWNSTATEYPDDLPIHQLFERQVARTPDAIAVVAGETQVTYRELNRRANQLAHYLRTLDLQPNSPVGLFTERSLLTVIGILGILKAGAAYLPLDASYPPARLQFMLQDAQVSVVLTQQKMLGRLPDTNAKVICLEQDAKTFSHQSEDNPANITQPEDLAYVIYTSGSTGQPKGAAIVHRAVNRLVFNTNYIQLDATDCIAQISNVSFDAATFELWGALLHGAKLVIINKDIALSPREFADQLRAQKITTLFVTTALFNLLARETPTAFGTLTTLLFGGEACDPNCIREVLKNGAPKRLLHVYGPTENTTFSSWHLIEHVPENASTVPIGRPISNSTMYLLDRNLNPVPVGVHGEIYVGGDGLAREYLRQPELTAEKFLTIADCRLQIAKVTAGNSQLYRTGDIARYLPDGSIEFIGRKDHQIKLRGFRIELGEIEAACLAHPAIQKCLVIAQGEEKRLLAYYVPMPETALSIGELRDFLKQRLPDYMLPTAFLKLDEMPLTANGKIDRQKLPQPENPFTESGKSIVQAKDELEVQLTRIWEQVLNVGPIGVRDNFFELGGHSLIAVRLFTAIEKQFCLRLPLATLFQCPTIEQLAEVLRQQGWQSTWQSLVALRSQGTKPPFFCVHAVGGNVLEYNDLARYFDADQPFYGLQSVGLDGQQAPLTNIEYMAAHYIREMRHIQPSGPYYLGGRSFGGAVAYEMARQLRAQGEEIGLLAMLDTYPLGWMKLMPPREAQQYQKHFLRLRIKRHITNLRSLRLTDKVDYILGKAEYKKRKYKNLWWRASNYFGVDKTESLNRTLRDIEELNFLAAKKYTPQVYQGKITFFCAEEEVSLDENIFGWQRLAADGLEIVRVPGNHQTMIKEPHVQTLAKHLMENLNRAMRHKG